MLVPASKTDQLNELVHLHSTLIAALFALSPRPVLASLPPDISYHPWMAFHIWFTSNHSLVTLPSYHLTATILSWWAPFMGTKDGFFPYSQLMWTHHQNPFCRSLRSSDSRSTNIYWVTQWPSHRVQPKKARRLNYGKCSYLRCHLSSPSPDADLGWGQLPSRASAELHITGYQSPTHHLLRRCPRKWINYASN